MIETECGEWPENRIHTHGASASHAHIDQSSNKALPWFGVAVVMAAIALSIAAYALAVCHQAKMDAWNAETRSILLQEYVEKMRFELASHGIKPPDYPTELKTKLKR